MSRKKTAVVGGGITGLSTAYFLSEAVKEGRLDRDVTVYEASDRIGGSIATEYTDGFVVERGPDSFLTRKMSMYTLAEALGMKEELVTNRSGAYIYHQKQMHPIPQGAIMGIPTQWSPFLKTKLFRPAGKVRAAMDLILPRGSAEEDESVGSFFRRRLGSEVVDNMIDPLLSGVYAGSLDKLSLGATFPQFVEVEKKHRSLILGMKKSRKKEAAAPVYIGPDQRQANMFLTFRRGLSSFVEQLAAALPEGTVETGRRMTGLQHADGRYQLHFSDGTMEEADEVLLTTRHHQAAELFDDGLLETLASAPSTTVATVALGYEARDVELGLDGTGFLVPKQEGYDITACTWTHQKWEHTAPPGKALLRAYVGRPDQEGIVEKTDEEIASVVRQDLKEIMGIDAAPLFVHVTRWRQGMPQYEVNHLKRLGEVRQKLAASYPGVHLLGASYNGIGLPDCVSQAEKAVLQIIEQAES
ncbi:protoporphyrinogen oxidase [Alkalicoccus urumqiensis]|uniref:Coproporphyrinogen III oxidase n=1 Tax=Alkalicoccus urumqiensis TaxID=1548213 RepID=A0A2P6MFC0_ALKUR|nr:protoporphyrinogen oxidase [Alkalicoccus urumqiensis]PRO64995.1 protoporphyrinogen oxidase [Alkalicoccus urumqiensis]